MKLIIFLLVTCYSLLVTTLSFAQTLAEAQVQYLQCDYQQAIDTLEKLLSLHVDRRSPPELYYLLGLSYLKSNNLLRASDCFDIIIKEYPDSLVFRQAQIKLIDIDLLREDFKAALEACDEFSRRFPQSEFASAIVLRRYKAQLKLGNAVAAKDLKIRLESDYPQSPENKAIEEKLEKGVNFCVQVGSFKDKLNAQSLVQSLKQKGFDSYIADGEYSDNLYRVRVGRLNSLGETKALEKRLSEQGLPTKIFP